MLRWIDPQEPPHGPSARGRLGHVWLAIREHTHPVSTQARPRPQACPGRGRVTGDGEHGRRIDISCRSAGGVHRAGKASASVWPPQKKPYERPDICRERPPPGLRFDFSLCATWSGFEAIKACWTRRFASASSPTTSWNRHRSPSHPHLDGMALDATAAFWRPRKPSVASRPIASCPSSEMLSRNT